MTLLNDLSFLDLIVLPLGHFQDENVQYRLKSPKIILRRNEWSDRRSESLASLSLFVLFGFHETNKMNREVARNVVRHFLLTKVHRSQVERVISGISWATSHYRTSLVRLLGLTCYFLVIFPASGDKTALLALDSHETHRSIGHFNWSGYWWGCCYFARNEKANGITRHAFSKSAASQIRPGMK